MLLFLSRYPKWWHFYQVKHLTVIFHLLKNEYSIYLPWLETSISIKYKLSSSFCCCLLMSFECGSLFECIEIPELNKMIMWSCCKLIYISIVDGKCLNGVQMSFWNRLLRVDLAIIPVSLKLVFIYDSCH